MSSGGCHISTDSRNRITVDYTNRRGSFAKLRLVEMKCTDTVVIGDPARHGKAVEGLCEWSFLVDLVLRLAARSLLSQVTDCMLSIVLIGTALFDSNDMYYSLMNLSSCWI